MNTGEPSDKVRSTEDVRSVDVAKQGKMRKRL